ncbi:MAG: glycosyltransferase family 2 protein [Lachnospiraceae bacterium]|nr:glycosyltransferase family 2 protein [Lachnospiraceae bacterium]
MDKISVIIPCYNEQEAIPIFYKEIQKTAEELSHQELELLFVNDGSKDGSLEEMKHLSEADPRVKYVSFSRNFGKEAAMYAGLSYASGDYIAIMDVDLQDPPALLPEMYRILTTEDYDCVATRRVTRKGEPPIRSFFARRFYGLMHRLSKTEIVDGARDYRLMTRQFVDELLRLGEYNRFSKGLFGWVGFRTKWLEYENVERSAGETKWSFWKLLIYSIEGIVGFTTAPLVMAAFLGILFCLMAFIAICFIVIRTILYGDPVSGWPSMTCIIVFLGGIQLFCMGILGEYLAKTYMETKHRPIFICKETNIENDGKQQT